jgi:L-alanine-DL-glutamate epimerase-like enolase superfamily enzyme
VTTTHQYADRFTIAIDVERRQLRRSFQISHMTITHIDMISLVVAGGDHEPSGFGEIAADPGYGQHAHTIVAEARALAEALVAQRAPGRVPLLSRLLSNAAPSVSGPARMLVEMAFLDHAAKVAGVAVWQLLDIAPPAEIRLQHTVPIGEPIPERIRPVKIKLGGDRDLEVLERLVGVPGPLILDVNRGWDRAAWNRVRALVRAIGPAVIEDPVSDPGLLPEVRRALPNTAVVLDESIAGLDDVREATKHADGANIKLMRFGGLLPALEAIQHLTRHSAERMLGCFLEPPRSIAYAAQLAGMCDWTDLDGHFWLTDDPSVMSYHLDSRAPGVPRIAYPVTGVRSDAPARSGRGSVR